MKRRNNCSLASDLARLPSLDRAALTAAWQTAYGTEPPRSISHPLMLRALAYHMQEQALGGLKPSMQRYLIKIAEDGHAARATAVSVTQVKPGTRLLREWHGVSHEVTVLDDGVYYQGQRYRSLSQIAQVITGAKWSGPLFFGLKKEAA
ncbi:MAG: DUF2924 domain-containing protein [Alphaproteobacteria bacterium]|nr:DUF2924 domain-containing protein [Alphaproteobacteria bacterium]